MFAFSLMSVQAQGKQELDPEQAEMMQHVLSDSTMMNHMMQEMANNDEMRMQMMETMMNTLEPDQMMSMCMMMMHNEEMSGAMMDHMKKEGMMSRNEEP